jgi:hypothetical protein
MAEFVNDNNVIQIHSPTEDKINAVKDSFYKEVESMFYKFPKYHIRILLP